MNVIIKELTRTTLKQQVVIWVLFTLMSKYMIYNGSVRTDFFYLVPYFFAVSIVLETGYSSESLFFDGISVLKKNFYKDIFLSKVMIYVVFVIVNLMIDFVLFNNNLLSFSIFLICILSSNIVFYNFTWSPNN